MNNSLLYTVAGGALLAGSVYAAPFALIPFAEKNVFFTYIKAGNGKRINRGGDFHTFIISYPGYHLNDPVDSKNFDPSQRPWEVIAHDADDDDYYDNRPKWMKRFGFYWIGIPGQRSVDSYKFTWVEENGHTPDGALVLRERKDETTEIFKVASFPYVIVESKIMTKNNLEVKVVYVISMRISNPYLAFIENTNWLASISAVISEQVRNFMGSFDIEQLVSLTDEEKGSEAAKNEMFAPPILKLNDRLAEEPEVGALGTKGKFGITITAAEINRIFPFGPKAEAYMEALTAEFMAEKEAGVVRIGADAAAYKTTTEGTATAEVIEATKKAEAAGVEALKLAEAAGNAALFKAADKHIEGAKVVLGTDALKAAKGVYVIPNQVTDLAGAASEALRNLNKGDK